MSVELSTQAGRNISTKTRKQPLQCRHAMIVALTAAIFCIDTFTALGSAIAVLYVLVQILAGETSDRRVIMLVSATCAGLTGASFVYVHGMQLAYSPLFRLLFSLAVNLATCLVLLRRSHDRRILEIQARMLERTSDAILVRDGNGQIIYWNKGAEILYGGSRSLDLGLCADAGSITYNSGLEAQIYKDLTAYGVWNGEVAVRGPAGRAIHVDSRWYAERDRNGQVLSALEVAVDISRQKAVEDKLKASEQRYRTIFETLAVAVWEHDFRAVKAELEHLQAAGVFDLHRYLTENPDFVRWMRRLVRITDANQTALTLMEIQDKSQFCASLDEFLAQSDTSFVDCLVAIAQGHRTFQCETVIRTRNGRDVPVLVALNFPDSGEAFDAVHASIVDMTDRLAFQDALEQSRRELEHVARAAMIGEVSASIAHEINQPLSSTLINLHAAKRWLERDVPDVSELASALNEAIASTVQTAAVVKRVRALLGKGKSEEAVVDVDQLLAKTLQLKGKELAASHIQISLKLEAQGAHIIGDRILLQQMLLNIIANAAQAMKETPTVARQLLVTSFIEQDSLVVCFADTGHGLKQSGEALFKAFTTTKTDGMGLGLAMCRSIAMAHAGAISICNRSEASGAVVEIRLPLGEGVSLLEASA